MIYDVPWSVPHHHGGTQKSFNHFVCTTMTARKEGVSRVLPVVACVWRFLTPLSNILCPSPSFVTTPIPTTMWRQHNVMMNDCCVNHDTVVPFLTLQRTPLSCLPSMQSADENSVLSPEKLNKPQQTRCIQFPPCAFPHDSMLHLLLFLIVLVMGAEMQLSDDINGQFLFEPFSAITLLVESLLCTFCLLNF
jgi:hypothetical protein